VTGFKLTYFGHKLLYQTVQKLIYYSIVVVTFVLLFYH
jgi:hypothetical protein